MAPNLNLPSKLRLSRIKLRIARPSIEFYGLLLSLGLGLGLLLFRLSSLTAGLVNSEELNTKHQLFIFSPWWKSLNGIYGPYYALLHLTYALNRSVYGFRLASVIIALLVVFAVYILVSSWHGYKIGILASVIVVFNLGLLSVGREATPLVSQLLLFVALLLAIAVLNRKPSLIGLILLMFVLAGAFYLPGGIWVALVGIVLVWRAITSAFKAQKLTTKILTVLLPLVLLVPLAYQLIAHYQNAQLKTWLGYNLGNKLSTAGHNFLLNFIRVPGDLFFHSDGLSSALSIGHLPVLPITFSVLFLLGLISYLTRLANWRWRSVLILMAAGWLISSFGIISPLALLPLVSVTTGTGIAFLLKEWYSIFPRNPIARNLGLMIMFLVIGLGAVYGARSYFVAWANDPATTSSYNRHLN